VSLFVVCSLSLRERERERERVVEGEEM
jgi:hypothetical protein